MFDGGRTIDIAAHQADAFLILFQQTARELGRSGGLARTLQAGHQDHYRRLGGQIERAILFAHEARQLVAHHADQGLSGGQRTDHFLADSLAADLGNEITHHFQANVGFEQGDAHLAQRLFDILL